MFLTLSLNRIEKRKAAQKAEIDFFALLKEKGNVYQGASWKVVKRGLEKDPRYDAVGSSTLREELFNSYVSRSIDVRHPKSSSPRSMEETDTERKRKDKDRKERAVREREAWFRTQTRTTVWMPGVGEDRHAHVGGVAVLGVVGAKSWADDVDEVFESEPLWDGQLGCLHGFVGPAE